MIDFKNKNLFKLKSVSNKEYEKRLTPLLIDGEVIVASFQSIRDGMVFTNKRIIAINIQGITGKKTDYTSIPYNNIQTYSVETSGVFDLDSELTVFISSIGNVVFEFTGSSNITEICKIISEYALR